MVLELLEALVLIFGYFLFLAAGFFAIVGAIALVAGLSSAVVSLPLLYVLPDVRRYLQRLVTPGTTDDLAPWRLAFRRRFVGLGAGFGLCYLVVFLVLFVPVAEWGLLAYSVGPFSAVVVIPVAFAAFLVPTAYLASADSPAVRPTTSRARLFGQWACFVSALVTLASLAPWATFWVMDAVPR